MLSGIYLARLIVSMIVGRQVVSRARPIADGSLASDAAAASTHLGLRVRPDLLASDRAACPVIWCWGRRPVILLPEMVKTSSVDWIGVFCHELAHWVRRDHVASLIAEFLTCLLPWHPLAWWARQRLSQLSELACDDWAIASGREPVAYAETLINLVPRRRMSPAMAAVSRRGGLAGRVAHIIETDGAVEPRPGRRWSAAMALAAIGLVATIAMAQAREGRARPDEGPATRDHGQPPAAQETPRDTATHRVVRGTVRDTSGKPLSGASIFAVGEFDPKPQMVDGRLEYRGERVRILAEVSSDRDGKFALDLALDPEVLNLAVIARSAGMGLAGHHYSVRPGAKGQMPFELLGDREVNLTLPPNVPIEGRILSPSGSPVSGVEVQLDSLSFGDDVRSNQIHLSVPQRRDGQPTREPYWPDPAVTDGEGRFRIDGFSDQAQAELSIRHDDYVHEALTVSTKAELSDWHKQWNIPPVAPRFSHVLEPARPIVGVVTDQDTGRPIAGVDIEMAVSRAPQWRFRFHTKTDDRGRYRVVGVAWNFPRELYTNVTPAVTSGYLPTQRHREQWPAGAKELQWDFSLKKGRLLRGRVIDADTKQPVAGAQVDGGSTVLTDGQGTFALSTFPGSRSVFVEGPTPDYQRVTVPRRTPDDYYTYYPHGYARIEVPREGNMAPLEIAIKKGATIAAQAVDPDGKPLPDVWVSGLSLYAALDRGGETSGHFSNGLFRMSSFVPGQTYRIFFIQNDRHLAGFADLEARSESTEPVKVTLKPTATVKGKLLKPDGSPDRGRGISVHVLMSRDAVKLDTMGFLVEDQTLSYSIAGQRGNYHEARTNDQGEFEVRDLMAGVTNYLATLISSNGSELIPIEPLRPGEVRELGAVKPVVLKVE